MDGKYEIKCRFRFRFRFLNLSVWTDINIRLH